MSRSPPRPRAYAPDPAALPGRYCDSHGCPLPGSYRAPKSRSTLNAPATSPDYLWFCLEHVRAYNLSWDYYKGMTPGQIEAETRSDTAWGRPTWPLGSLGSQTFDETQISDPLHLLATGRIKRDQKKPGPGRGMPAEMREPIQTLGLDWPVSLDVLKTRYKELAKRHHPDANGGDRAAEERLKSINLAYAAVRHYLTDTPRMAASA